MTRAELLAQYNCPVNQSREILLTGGSSDDTRDGVKHAAFHAYVCQVFDKTPQQLIRICTTRQRGPKE